MTEFWDDSGIRWTICKQSAPRSRQITTPTPHNAIFLHSGCSSRRPTNSVKALKARMQTMQSTTKSTLFGRWQPFAVSRPTAATRFYLRQQVTVKLMRGTMVAVDEEVVARQLAEKQQLEDDVDVLNQIIDLSSKLNTPHDVCCIVRIA